MQAPPTNLNAREFGGARTEKTGFNCSAYVTFPFPVIRSSANSGKIRVGTKSYTLPRGSLRWDHKQFAQLCLKTYYKRSTEAKEDSI